MPSIEKLNAEEIAEQATGCVGAGGSPAWAAGQGYGYCEVLDQTSSAGDWVYIVSKDGMEWRMLFQSNNYPSPGFSRWIGDRVYFGTAEEVMQEIFDQF